MTVPRRYAPRATRFLALFAFLGSRHTWNQDLLSMPEPELFEAYQHCRRAVVGCASRMRPAALNAAMERVVSVVTDSERLRIPRGWGTIAGGSSTVIYSGGATVVEATNVTYNDLQLTGTGPYSTSGGVLTANGDLLVGGAATFTPGGAVSVGGNWTNDNVFTHVFKKCFVDSKSL